MRSSRTELGPGAFTLSDTMMQAAKSLFAAGSKLLRETGPQASFPYQPIREVTAMSNTKYTALFLGALSLAMSVPQATAQVLQPIGTLTISDVTAQPISIFRAGVGYALLGTGGGGGAPEPASFTDFTLTKLLDSTSPMLLVNAASGRLFAQARIDLFGPDGQTVLTSYELFD